MSNKARLFAVKMNKKDRKGRSEIESCSELRTPEGFWLALYGQYDLILVHHCVLMLNCCFWNAGNTLKAFPPS